MCKSISNLENPPGVAVPNKVSCLALGMWLFAMVFSAMSQEVELLTPEEIWQEGASWEEIAGGGPVCYHSFISGAVEYEGKTYLKVFSSLGSDEAKFWYGINVCGSKISLYVENLECDEDTTEAVAFSYCDFREVEVGKEFSHKSVRFFDNKFPVFPTYTYPVFKSKSVVGCPDIPDKGLEIYSNEDDVNATWRGINTRMIVSGLGAVSDWSFLIWPYYEVVPGGSGVHTLSFRDGLGREIFRHPHYERIIEALTGVKDVSSEDETSPVFYNLQGIRLPRPISGEVMIEVNGGRSRKVIR